MKTVHLLLSYLALFSVLHSCMHEERTSQDSSQKIELKLIDSLKINVLEDIDIYDYNPDLKLFLAGDVASPLFADWPGGKSVNNIGHIIFDATGKIQYKFNQANQGPDGHGLGALNSYFYGTNQIAVLGQKGMFIYNFNGVFQRKIAELNYQNYIGLFGTGSYHVGAINNEGMLGISYTKYTDNIYNYPDSLYQLLSSFHLYDLNLFENDSSNEALIQAQPFPKSINYQNPNEYFNTELPPRVTLNRFTNEAIVLYHNAPILEIYDMNSGELKKSLQLKLNKYQNVMSFDKQDSEKHLEWINNGGFTASSYFHGLIQLGEYTLISYNTAIPKSSVSELVKTGGFKSEQWPALRKKHYHFRYQLIKDGEQWLSDFELPLLEPLGNDPEFNSLNQTRGIIIGGDDLNRIYVFYPNNKEIERDYQLIKVYKLNVIN